MPALEHALAALRGSKLAGVARDAYSLIHYLMLLGVIAYAFAIEEAVAHPAEALPLEGRLALAIGLFLFVGGMALATWRATRRLMVPRVLVILITAVAVVAVAGVAPAVTLGIAFLGVVTVAATEQWGILV
jgi:low temperature requirement protein LtrA